MGTEFEEKKKKINTHSGFRLPRNLIATPLFISVICSVVQVPKSKTRHTITYFSVTFFVLSVEVKLQYSLTPVLVWRGSWSSYLANVEQIWVPPGHLSSPSQVHTQKQTTTHSPKITNVVFLWTLWGSRSAQRKLTLVWGEHKKTPHRKKSAGI